MGRFKAGEKKYICKICSKSCASGRSLGGHMKLHSNSSSKNHCELKIDESNELDPKNRATDLYYKCQKCEKEFGSTKALFGHMKCHSTKKSITMRAPPVNNDDHREKLPELKSFICQTRRKRSRIKYNIMREEEVEDDVAECLILLSRGTAPKFESSSHDQMKNSAGNDDGARETEHKQDDIPLLDNGPLCNADEEQICYGNISLIGH